MEEDDPRDLAVGVLTADSAVGGDRSSRTQAVTEVIIIFVDVFFISIFVSISVFWLIYFARKGSS